LPGGIKVDAPKSPVIKASPLNAMVCSCAWSILYIWAFYSRKRRLKPTGREEKNRENKNEIQLVRQSPFYGCQNVVED
jgi:hypothetical protein